MQFNVFKMFVGRLIIISVLLYNTEAFDDMYIDEFYETTETAAIANATMLVEDKTPTNRTETINWYYGSDKDENNNTLHYESVPVEDSPASNTVTTNRWSYGSDSDEKNKTWDYEPTPVEVPPAVSDRKANFTDVIADKIPYDDDVRYLTVAHLPKKDYEKENNTKNIDWPYNWLFDTVTTTRRTYYSNSSHELENDKNTTETSDYRYNKTVLDSESTRRPYHSNRYHGRWTQFVNNTTIPRNLTTTARYGYHFGTNDTGYYITTKDFKHNWIASVFPIVNKTNSSDRNVTNKATTDQVHPKSTTNGRNPVNILINSSINANESKINGTFTDFLKKISGYILPSTKYVAPNSNVTNLAVAEGNGNSFFYAYNLIIGS